MATFALVHGSWHGAWCWERLEPELAARGHLAIAIDLPIEDPDAGVARHRPLRHLVFLAALVPEPGRSVTDRYTTEDVYVPGFVGNTLLRDDGASYWPDPEAAVRCFYHDCTAADAAWAVSRLRPQSAAPRLEPWPLDALPDVDRTSIVCRDERVIAPAWSRTMSRDLLGVEPLELDGGHSPFLSRPAELADILVRLG